MTANPTRHLDADLLAIADVRSKATAARRAFEAFNGASQDEIDHIVRAMATAGDRAAESLAKTAVTETGYGVYEDKILKNRFNTQHVAEWILGLRTVGVLWHDDVGKVTAIGAPMGVIAGLIPVTNPTSTVLFKSLAAVKAGNAIVHSPHPRATQCSRDAAEVMAEAAVSAGAPEGLVSCLETPSLEATEQLMAHPDVALVLATGGAAMVRSAYSSGKPTIAVGAGNVPVIVDESAPDLSEAAEMIVTSKSFDNGTACVAEQTVIVHQSIAERFDAALSGAGAAFLDADGADRLAAVIFTERGALRPENVGQSAVTLAERCGLTVPATTRVLIARPGGIGREFPLSAEILGPVLTVYTARDSAHCLELARQILDFGGVGHTAVLHASDQDLIARFSALDAGRLLINTPALFGGMGYSTGIEPSFQLGTGTWSGSICSDNVTPLHLVNIKRLAAESRPWRSLYDSEPR